MRRKQLYLRRHIHLLRLLVLENSGKHKEKKTQVMSHLTSETVAKVWESRRDIIGSLRLNGGGDP